VSGETVPDSKLLERIARRDGAAFDELYRRYASPVLGLALRRTRERGRAEDATQEVFTAVWRSAGTFDPTRGRATAWLFTIARNVLVDGYRRQSEQPIPTAPDSVDSAPGPDVAAETSWLSWRVHRALAELPEAERILIELAYWGGLSQSEIAARLDLPLGTVKTRTRSGLNRLAGELEEELG
jgi:RNA polymerase sigma-70 factor (ECF subfamily)